MLTFSCAQVYLAIPRGCALVNAMRHECKYWKANLTHYYRRCDFCGRIQYNYQGVWKDEIKLERFCKTWLPATQHSSDFSVLMQIDVAYPFEFNSYESWNTAFKVRFPPLEHQKPVELTTAVDFMQGYETPWRENLNLLQIDLEQKFAQVTGRQYKIGDNLYLEMRNIVQG